MNKLYYALAILALIMAIGNCIISYGHMKSIIPLVVHEQLDIAESRHREDLLLQEVKLLDYQVDILTKQVLH